ncbi:DUF6520 family protein [Flavobacterium sp. GSB-24]|uniref:DUF6520 family protein n=1 Tax=Flavobacterium sp. GSB-24 TaxID=2994319 RepID=UPI002491EF3A|nr:DUF6520 family protein [Flavobacterium sp. GSB-24]
MKKVILPALVIVLAVTSAFTTEATSKKSASTVNGYLPHNSEGTDCEQKNSCSDVNNGTVCRVGQSSFGQQLYILNDNDECLRIGYKP